MGFLLRRSGPVLEVAAAPLGSPDLNSLGKAPFLLVELQILSKRTQPHSNKLSHKS